MKWKDAVKAVVFDFAGTLVDGRLDVSDSRRKAVALLEKKGYRIETIAFDEAMEAALKVARKKRASCVETPYSYVIGDALSRLGINPTADLIREIEDSDFACYHWHLRSGVREAVVTLHDDILLGVISNSWTDSVKRILTESGLAEYFDVIVLSKDIGYRKPDRRIFLHVAKLLELNPGQVVFVGDSFADDVLGPSAAGMIPVWKGVAVGVDSLDIPPVLARMLPI